MFNNCMRRKRADCDDLEVLILRVAGCLRLGSAQRKQTAGQATSQEPVLSLTKTLPPPLTSF